MATTLQEKMELVDSEIADLTELLAEPTELTVDQADRMQRLLDTLNGTKTVLQECLDAEGTEVETNDAPETGNADEDPE